MVDKLDLNDLGLTFNANSNQSILAFLYIMIIGFGPVAGAVWDNYDGKFYQPYNKRERIGKICDFVA